MNKLGQNTTITIGGKQVNLDISDCDIDLEYGTRNNKYNIEVVVAANSEADMMLKQIMENKNENK